MNGMYLKYHIQLSDRERSGLQRVLEDGQKLGRVLTRARILLLADSGKKDKEIAKTLRICPNTVYNVRKRFVEQRLIGSVEDKPRSGKPPKLRGITAAHISKLACSKPPEGHKRWTLRLLARSVVDLKLLDSVSHESVRRVLRTNVEDHPLNLKSDGVSSQSFLFTRFS